MNVPLAIAASAWMVEAFALGYVMRRRGYDAYSWTFLGTVLGPLAVIIAVGIVLRPRSREPRVLHGGRDAGGPIDVLVGVDGSLQATAAIERAAALFGTVAGRVTFARVVPIDATRETEQLAEKQLVAATAGHPTLDATTVVLRGEPVSALRDYVSQLGYEVLVVGTRGEGKTRAMLGSVAMALARGAGIPVLLVDDVSADRDTTVPSPAA